MEEKIGIEAISRAIIAVVKLTERINSASEDGKVTIAESLSIGVATVPDLVFIVKNGKQIKAEFKDLDRNEVLAIADLLKSEIELENKKAEEIIENAIDVIAGLSMLLVD